MVYNLSHRSLVLVSKTPSPGWNYSGKALQGEGMPRWSVMTQLNTLHDFFFQLALIYMHLYIHIPEPCTDPRHGRDSLYVLHESFLKHHLTGIIAYAESSSPRCYLPTCLSTSRNRSVIKHNPTQRRGSPGLGEAGGTLSSPPSIRNNATSHTKSSFSLFC